MSELTQCNYCSLQKIKTRYGADNVQLVPAQTLVPVNRAARPPTTRASSEDIETVTAGALGWQDVMVRDSLAGKWERIGHSFMVVTAHCVC